jgi:hypothetical protein
MINGNLAVPEGIKGPGYDAYLAIIKFLSDHDLTDTGGCKTFYTPEEWKARGEQYGLGSLLVVVHDGGAVAEVCNLDYENYGLHDELQDALKQAGFYMEGCTSWYSAVYPV